MQGETQDRPILIVGIMRSGTTLLDRILNTHSKLSFLFPGTDFFKKFYRKYDPIGENVKRLLHEFRDYMRMWSQNLSDKDLESIRDYSLNWGLSYKSLYCGIADRLLHPTEHGRWGEKYAGFGAEIAAFLAEFPKGQVIGITRNLADAYVSNSMKVKSANSASFERGDHLLILDDWRRFTRTWKDLEARDRDRRHILVTYEDLVTHPQSTTQRVCDFLGVPWEADMTEPGNWKDNLGTPWTANTSFQDPINGLDPRTIGRHRRSISQEELDLVNHFQKSYSLDSREEGGEPPDSPLARKLETVIRVWDPVRSV